jgi:hypothetical protein
MAGEVWSVAHSRETYALNEFSSRAQNVTLGTLAKIRFDQTGGEVRERRLSSDQRRVR